MPPVADAEGESSSFVFVLPVRDGWADELATISLEGRGESIALGAETVPPMAILQDPLSGQVVGFLDDLPEGTVTENALRRLGFDSSVRVMASRGIPAPAQWRR